MKSGPLLVNLSFLIQNPTGISTYATHVLPYLQPLAPTLLSAAAWNGFAYHAIPNNLTPAQGIKGHIRRLCWTQCKLPKIYQQLRSRLLFSPVPEAPIFTDCRSVVMVHDLIPLRFPRRFSGLTYYFRYGLPWVLRQAEHIVCNSTATAQEMLDRFNLPEAKITSIPLAYDSRQFNCQNVPRQNYFLYLGRPDPHKNLSRLIAAFGQLPKHLDTALWIAGSADPRYTPRLMAQVETLGLADRVKFLDYVPYSTLPTLYGEAIALVFPSLWEGFGLPILEAMACGTPVITSNRSALPEVAGNAAVLVNPYNPGEIAEAMHQVASDRQLWQHLQQAGLARSQEFSWAKTGQTTAAILDRFL